MTTLVALASKHAVVLGADSLGTQTRGMISPGKLLKYFDPQNSFKLKTDDNGEPLLKDIAPLFEDAEIVPYNQLHSVNKLFRLGELPMGVAFTGATSIGNRTIRALISEFTQKEPAITSEDVKDYTVEQIANALLQSLRVAYEAAYPQSMLGPALELLVAGYDLEAETPSVFRIDVQQNSSKRVFEVGRCGIAFAGQMEWMQRIVFGTDNRNRVLLAERSKGLLQAYREKILDALKGADCKVELPEVESYGDEFQLFHDWDLNGFDANWEQFSEQNAIDCVDFFLDIMIKAQAFGPELPTVGGDVHIAVIRKDGFHLVSKEVWRHRDNEVDIPGVGI